MSSDANGYKINLESFRHEDITVEPFGHEDITVIIREWEIIREGETAYLKGRVYEHPMYDDGTLITTSEIVEIEDDIATVYSGKKYLMK